MQKTPPRYVPTLTQVVPPVKVVPLTPAGRELKAEELPPDLASDIAHQLRQKLIVQVHTQIDLQLQQRIRETVSQLALAHSHRMMEEMRPLIETAVVKVVDEAMAQALAHVSENGS